MAPRADTTPDGSVQLAAAVRPPHFGTGPCAHPQRMGREFADILMWTGLMSFGDHVRVLRRMNADGYLSDIEANGLILGLCHNYACVARPLGESLAELGEAELVAQLLEDCGEAELAKLARTSWPIAHQLSLWAVQEISWADGVLAVELDEDGGILRAPSVPNLY